MSNYCNTCQHYRVTAGGPHCYKGRIKPVSPITKADCWEPVTEQPEPLTKVCKRCGRELPLSSFGRHPKTRDGYQPVCREFRSAEMKGNPRKGSKKKEQAPKPEPAPVHEPDTAVTLTGATDDQLVEELRNRGYTGNVIRKIAYIL